MQRLYHGRALIIINILGSCIGFAIVLYVSQNLRYQYLWYDEGVQFWVSKGIHPAQPALTYAGNFLDVIKLNKYTTLDPGGFNLLLHFWTFISNHVIWLRLLPFLFYLLFITTIFYLAFTKTKDYLISLIISFLPFYFSVSLNAASEIRPYSMEMAGTVLCLVAVEKIYQKLTYKRLITWSCIMSLFLTSRYSEFITVFSSSWLILFIIFKKEIKINKKILYTAIYILPLLLTAMLIYFISLKFQNSGLSKVHYQTYLSDDILFLLKGYNLLYFLIITIITIVYLYRPTIIYHLRYIYLNCIIVNWLFILLSFSGKYPWEPSSSRCISMVILTLITVGLTIWSVIKIHFEKGNLTNRWVLVFAFIGISLFYHDNFITRYGNFMAISFKKLDFELYKKIYVDLWETPYVKYLFEYGSMKNELGKSYPDNFTLYEWPPGTFFEKPKSDEFIKSGYKDLPRMNQLMEYDLLITPYLYNLGDNDKWKKMEGSSEFYIIKQK